MVMALSLISSNDQLVVVAGYEDGTTILARLTKADGWATIYSARPHSQPILSLDIAPDFTYVLTSSADAVIAKHPLVLHGPDGLREFAPLEGPSETVSDSQQQAEAGEKVTSLLSAGLQAQTRDSNSGRKMRRERVDRPMRTANTKHSGQQSLRVRSDGKIFATAGWDGRVRAYSAKTLKEVAVLKWHQSGCYAVAFSAVDPSTSPDCVTGEGSVDEAEADQETPAEPDPKGASTVLRNAQSLLQTSVRAQRETSARSAHWLATGSKDGKISLWNIF
jgi:WD40 repeat protein